MRRDWLLEVGSPHRRLSQHINLQFSPGVKENEMHIKYAPRDCMLPPVGRVLCPECGRDIGVTERDGVLKMTPHRPGRPLHRHVIMASRRIPLCKGESVPVKRRELHKSYNP